MDTESPQLAVSRVFDVRRALVFRAFTDPDHPEPCLRTAGRGRHRQGWRVPRRQHPA